jgi:spermidine/putrescine ABC transporter ATP-binding subunit
LSQNPVTASGAVPAVEFRNVSKTFGPQKAVKTISFDVKPGEFFSILGPSGCGKTTTLRMIAGFEQPDEDGGEVRLLGKVVNRLRPYDRGIAMVFQSYALFPHMTVAGNVAFGLEQRGVGKADIGPRVEKAMQMVRLDPGTFGKRLPAQLSGGQRQRVALARALVLEPPILLLDEPLGALDLKLRKEMQLELKTLNRQLGITFIFVTHDQEEALTMSDRIAVMDNARIAQLGTPAEIYEKPRTAFIARFIGESNFLRGQFSPEAGGRLISADGQHISLRSEEAAPRQAEVALRPEWAEVVDPGQGPATHNRASGTLSDVIYLGETLHLHIQTPSWGRISVVSPNRGQIDRPLPWQRGSAVDVIWPPSAGVLLQPEAT